MSNLVFVDVETTSLKPPARRPWEIALIDDKGAISMFIENVDLTGADKESLAKSKFYERHPDHNPHLSQPTWQEWYAAEWIQTFTRNKVLVGCAPWFDEVVLKEMFKRHNLEPEWTAYIDVQKSVKMYSSGISSKAPRGLEACAKFLKIDYDPEQAHGALYDAMLAKQIFEKVSRGNK